VIPNNKKKIEYLKIGTSTRAGSHPLRTEALGGCRQTAKNSVFNDNDN